MPKATHIGELAIGNLRIPCAVLPDGRRVLSQRGVGKALGRSYGGSDWSRQESDSDGGGKLPFFLSSKAINPFISNDLLLLVTDPILYRGAGGGVAHGVEATALPKICDVWLKAREAGALRMRPQLAVAQRAEILMRALAQVGVVALVDEATGYQEVRDRLALQAILDQYLRKELAAWAKRFPDNFYREIFRLRGWKWDSLRRPGIVAGYTKNIVYARIAPGILEELERKNPRTEKGYRKAKHHQWLTEEVGHPALERHLEGVMLLLRISDTWQDFRVALERGYPRLDGNQLNLPFN
ncbi:hypothetical protein A2G96_07810 [Cupriavidus nantongensis]|uniref:Bacteriophage Mx8 p63 C-terminal domain-containing protein n=2 Tax=Cupriavidus nantongensis TaxID=1796606 RepID=A0A142JQ89_9BURK|nr:hypothetical protein A2G96_07810 [Cupriavidus nantongensis]